MGVFLPVCLTFKCLTDGFGGLDQAWIDDIGSGTVAGIAGVGELDDTHGSAQCQSR